MTALLFTLGLVAYLSQALIFARFLWKERDLAAAISFVNALGWAVFFLREIHQLPRFPTTLLAVTALLLGWVGLLLLLRLLSHRPLPGWLRWFRWKG